MAIRRRRFVAVLSIYGVLAAALCAGVSLRHDGTAGAQNALPADPNRAYQEEVTPLLKKYCYECHNATENAAGLALDTYKTVDSLMAKRGKWDLVSKYVHMQLMPPEGKPMPTEAERARISGWIDGQMMAHYRANPDPGRVTLRRLNRREYNATIRDLVGISFEPAEDFPQDDAGYGFDNIGDVLSLSPILMEKYMAAADHVLAEAIPAGTPASRVRKWPASQTQIGFNALGDRGDGWVNLISLEEDDVAVELPLPPGDYIFRVRAFSTRTGGGVVGQGSAEPLVYDTDPGPTALGVFVGSSLWWDFVVEAKEDAPQWYEHRISVGGGRQRISAAVRRNRGGENNETYMLNGRIGTQQPGIVFVKQVELEGPLPRAVRRYPAKELERNGQGHFDDKGNWVMESNGEAGITVDVPRAGEYTFRVEAMAQQAGSELVKMEMRADGKVVDTIQVYAPATLMPLRGQRLFDVNLLNARPYVYEITAKLPAGKSKLTAAFVNDFQDTANDNPNLRDRNLIINWMEFADPGSPALAPPMPENFAKQYPKKNDPRGEAPAARETLDKFARRAYRRPVKTDEMDRLMRLYAMGREDGFDEGMRLAMKAVLVSPHFLFRGESPVGRMSARIEELDEIALASRLSYFLWSTMPDEELLAIAERGELRKTLDAQIHRMLASPKSVAFIQSFADQWLQLNDLAAIAPNRDIFKDFDDGVSYSMKRETELLFEHIVRENKNILELLTADYTFINGRLARFYGMQEDATPGGENFRRVSLAGTPRMGILTHGSVLTLTSNPTRTSPVKRGKYVLETLLGTPPPPPPPDVPELEEAKEGQPATKSLRAQMELHRADPTCASCHVQMDAIGFGLENFDAIGKWRDKDGASPVEAAGELRGGDKFKDARELANLLAGKKRGEFLHCVAEKLLTYALGRGVEPYDRPAVADIVKQLESGGGRFDALVIAVVKSMPFQMRRGGEWTETQATK